MACRGVKETNPTLLPQWEWEMLVDRVGDANLCTYVYHFLGGEIIKAYNKFQQNLTLKKMGMG